MITRAITLNTEAKERDMALITTGMIETMFAPAKADDVAAVMNANVDDDWNYVVVHDPKGTGRSFINVIDEDGEFVSKL